MTQSRRARLLACCLVLIAALGCTPLLARDAGIAEGVIRQELSVEPLAGDAGKEVVTDLYTLPPGTVLPWHVHPDAHEVSYVLSGKLRLEIEGEEPKLLEAGKSFYLRPNKVHRGLTEGDTPVRLFVVRIKPVDKPLAVEVEPGSPE